MARISTQATMKDDATALLMAQIDVVMRMVTMWADGILLAEVVAGGPTHWRKVFSQAFRAGKGLPIHEVDKIADGLFLFFSNVYLWREGSLSPAEFLDKVEESTPPTEKEIAEAWEIDSGSSEEGRRYFYGPDASAVIEQTERMMRDASRKPN
jgi:hypothetical protein